MRKVIHVHQAEVRKRDPQEHPAIIVRTYKGTEHFRRVECRGPFTIVHNDDPDSCGARVWIETAGEVLGYRNVGGVDEEVLIP